MIQRLKETARRRRQFWASVPLRGHVLLLAAVFSIFSTFGFLTDVMTFGRGSWENVLVTAFFSGVIAVFWVMAFTKHAMFAVPAAVLFVVFNWIAASTASQDLTGPLNPLRTRLGNDAVAVIVTVMAGYGLFILFIAVEGRRYLRAHTEVALAREIHQRLVPPIVRNIDGVEFFGNSIPSSEVGGDLVDVVEHGEGWVAYLADVSGHGVASGALMGMFKSAMRTRLLSGCPFDRLLDGVDRVMTDMRKPGMFVTCALVSMVRAPELQFTVAGHPPILHFRKATGDIDELSTPQPPVALLEDPRRFSSARTVVADGDMLALISDGLMEVFDRQDREYGLERVKRVLAAHAGRPLQELFDTLVADVRRHGPQLDDQSLLLVRVRIPDGS
ncbi:MAG TPA: PP2C family protein-serine/threonine phosphatase [Vicinamibacterales bacterium]|nr:PP2C family protein-serine/threonine phosphatase [Vicinamibacterales bacterium]